MFCASLRKWQSFVCGDAAAHSVHFPNGRAPTKIWVSDLWGLPRFTHTFRYDSSLWHFQGNQAFKHPFPCRHPHGCLNLWFRSAQTRRTSQSVSAWTFLTENCSIAQPADMYIIPYYLSFFTFLSKALRERSIRPLSSMLMTFTVTASPTLTTSSVLRICSRASLEM